MLQADAAARVGISQYWLSQVENGHERPSGALRERLLDLYGRDE
jgi:transcriptional regulator with XRE-family HTH domain